jgi:tetratricopeptide (TPR) repeat protein/DNA-binding winged helix-turn-helix (wHTH) protein
VIPKEDLITCNGVPMTLPPRCFELLLLFIDKPGSLLTKEFLMSEMWHSKAGESSLYYSVHALRRALRSCVPNQTYIENVSGRGYRFLEAVERVSEEASSNIYETNRQGTRGQPALHQLPPPISDFVGRQPEIKGMLGPAGNRDQTIIFLIDGMGGVGKTQLAVLVANDLRIHYPDAQLFIELSTATDNPVTSQDALAECIRAFSSDVKLPNTTGELSKLYRSLLHGLHALIVLDDAADSAQIKPLLPPRGCAVIITTRNALTVPGAIRLTLDQLGPEESRKLLTSIAPHVSEKVADEIGSLCGYLPLALRAAGSLLSVTPDLDPLEYVEALRKERASPSSIGTNRLNREVWASLNLSRERLTPESKRIFDRLAIFQSTFGAKAEEKICQDVEHVRLTELTQRSLVIYDVTKGRYHLHDLVRLLAAKHLRSDETNILRMLYAQYYEGVLRQANYLFEQGGKATVNGIALFDLERVHIQQGQEWASSLAVSDPIATELSNSYPIAGGSLLSLRLHPNDQIAWRLAALDAASHVGDFESQTKHWGYLGEAYRRVGNTLEAMRCHKKSLAMAQELGDRLNECIALGGIGNVHDNLGELRSALECYEHACEIARGLNDRRREGGALGNMGIAYWRMGDYQNAVKCHERHLKIAREIGDRLAEAYALGNLGLVLFDLHAPERTIELNEQALKIFTEIGDKRSQGDALGNIGRAYASLGEVSRAVTYYEREKAIARTTGNRELEAEALNYLGDAYAILDDQERAAKLFHRALALARQIRNRRIEGEILNNLSLAYDRVGDVVKAMTFADDALKIFTEIEDGRVSEVRKRLRKWHRVHQRPLS